MRHHLAGGSTSAVMTPARCRDLAHASLTRVTKEGRTLTYCLTVIQQPERARACGSGAKCKNTLRPWTMPLLTSPASADRRPVDPPPVVELRVFEGKNPADLVDVTFNYNANFFLFTTLEVARPIAHGRMQPQIQQIPVLTGMPVSGMAYLDRPSLAGYFIFPDLSVRHEGRYRLSFNLYEETKEARDADGEPSSDQTKPSVPSSPTSPSAPTASFDWRLEVKSDPFTVFSAKKFPGLAESTSLSRAVAEQGCRVRIRRDVRMRRRDNKPNTDYEAAQEGEYVRAGRTPSVQESRDRSRSLSNESAGRHPYGLERRLSGEYPGVYPHSSSRPQSYLNFGAPRNQHQAPPHRFAQPAPPAPMPYQSPLAPRPHQGHYRQPAPSPQDTLARLPHPQPAPPPQTTLSRLPYPQYAPPPTQPTRHQPDLNLPHPPEIPGQTPSRQNSADMIGPRTDTKGPTLPPMRNLNHQAHMRESRLTLAPIKRVISTPKLAPGQLRVDEPPPDQLESDPGDCSRTLDRVRPDSTPSKSMSKRSHEAAFDSKSNKTAPLHNGMRPEDDASPVQAIVDDPAGPESAKSRPAWMDNMEYRRADGSMHRILNPPY
jgi:hypothetical protein